MKVTVYESAAEACRAAAEAVAEAALRGPARVGLSGGKTAAAFFYVLAAAPVAWKNVELFWVDERCVPPDDPQSNYGLARKHLLAKVRVPEDQVHRFRGEDEPVKAAADYERLLRARAPGGLDLAVLGLGEDGHTASLFSGSPALEERERWTAVAQAPDGRPRLTLTPAYLALARRRAALVLGKDKRDALSRPDTPFARVDAVAPIEVLADQAARP